MTDQERYHVARRDRDLVVLEGLHAIKHALRFGAVIDDMVTSSPHALNRLAGDLAPDLAAEFGRARDIGDAFNGLTTVPTRTPVIAIAKRPQFDVQTVFTAAGSGPIVVLDRPRHPGNIGAAIRVAAARGAAGLFTTGDSDPWHAAAVRGGAGLQFALPVGTISHLPATERQIVAVHPDGTELDPSGYGHAPSALPGPVFLFGSERDGLSDEMLAAASRIVRIPMREGVSSLNLATAVAVILYSWHSV
ncbi:MAG: TrmH family RNA methyltransferase [Longimicrobiales bacterium]